MREPGLPGCVSRRLGEDVLSRETALPDRLAASGRAVVWSTRECDTGADGSCGSGSGRTASKGRGAGVPAMRDGSSGRPWLGTGPVAAEGRRAGGAAEGARDRGGDRGRDGRPRSSAGQVQGGRVRGNACARAAGGAVAAAG